MPEKGGLEAARIIRKLQIKQPTIIALTADANFPPDELFDFVARKPIEKEKLKSILIKYAGLVSQAE